MDQLLSFFVLLVAVTCVIVATQPVRPARPVARRSTPRAAQPLPDDAPAKAPATAYPWGDTQRWSRRDLQQAIAREHAFPGGESVWPPR